MNKGKSQLDLEYINGQTPLGEDKKEGLLIPTIATREGPDEFEQQNIEQAIQWLLGRSLKTERVLDSKFICNLHKRMFDNVWAWAGTFRKTNKNPGIDHWQIPMALKSLCDDALYWIKNETYPPEEIALQFKHRIVSIHCFPNGNGRHSRLMGDVIIEKIFGQPLFSWGASDLIKDGGTRTSYLKALREADNNSYDSLLKFARS